MSFLTTDDGARLFFRVDGPEDGPPVLFLNSLGCDHRMWDAQVNALADQFRIVRFDTRGHGQSDVPPGPYSVERLGLDALAVMDHLGVEQANINGLSLGGLIALWLAIFRPTRVRRAVFANTAARIGSLDIWKARIEAVEQGGMASIHDVVLGRFLSAAYQEREPATTAQISRTILATSPVGYVGCCGALRDADLRNMVSTIEARSLVIGGELDQSTPPSQAEDLHGAIVPSELMVIPGVAHLSNLEAPDLFTRRTRELFAG